MIKNGKKNKIKDLYTPFRCKEMPGTADRIDGLPFQTLSTSKWQSQIFYLVFLSFFIIYLTLKSFLTILIFFFSENFSLSPVLIQNKSLRLLGVVPYTELLPLPM